MVVVAVGVAVAVAGEKGEGGSVAVWGVTAVAWEGEMGLSVKMGMPDMVRVLEMNLRQANRGYWVFDKTGSAMQRGSARSRD